MLYDVLVQIFLSYTGNKASKKLLTYIVYLPCTAYILFAWQLDEWYHLMQIRWLWLPLGIWFLMMLRDLYILKTDYEHRLWFRWLFYILPSIWIIKSILAILLA